MNRQSNKLYWLAGILEGEGCFDVILSNQCPRIRLGMTDLDVIQEARNIMNPSLKIATVEQTGKDRYDVSIAGSVAVQWMMTLYPLMHSRRKEKIREILFMWKNQDDTQKKKYKPRSTLRDKGVKAIMYSRNVSYEEAAAILRQSIGEEGDDNGTIQ